MAPAVPTGPLRLKRLAFELRVRRRRLGAYRNGPPWPGKDHTWRSELRRYDRFLLMAATMLEVPAPEPGPDGLLTEDARAVVEDRLAVAGLDVMAPSMFD